MIEEKTTCEDCGQPFTFYQFKVSHPLPDYCESCHLKRWPNPDAASMLRAAEERARRERWIRICPDAYRTIDEGGKTDIAKLPAELLKKVTEWKPETSLGISLCGPTGSFKSRIMWRLMRRLFEQGKKLVTFDCSEFSNTCTAAFREGREAQWREWLRSGDIVFFDDLWKDTMTERVDSEIFSALEYFSSHRVPYFITTNFTGDLLEERAKKPDSKMSLDRLQALLRRVRQDCTRLLTHETKPGHTAEH